MTVAGVIIYFRLVTSKQTEDDQSLYVLLGFLLNVSAKWKFCLKKYLLAEPLYDIQLFIFIRDTSAMPVIVLHHWFVPQPSGGPFCARGTVGEGPILVNLCSAVSSHACVLGTSNHWRALGSPERVPVLICGTAIVHPLLPSSPPPPTCPWLLLVSSAQLD